MLISFMIFAYAVPLDLPLMTECAYFEAQGIMFRPWLKPYDLNDLVGRLDPLVTGDYHFSRAQHKALSNFMVLLSKTPDFSTLVSIAADHWTDPGETRAFLDYRMGGRIADPVSFHQAVRFQGSSVIDTFPPYPWKEHVKAYLNEATLRFEPTGLRIALGRQNYQAGTFIDEGLLLAPDPQGYDGFSIEIPRRYYEFNALYATLSACDNRHLALHRLGATLGSVRIGFAEAIVWGGNLEPLYLTPLVPYYLAQWGMHRDDNILWVFDASFRLFRTSVHGEFLIDDFQYGKPDGFEVFPNKLAFKVGLEKTVSGSLLAVLSYTFIDKWVYTQRIADNAYFKDQRPLGSPLGNDADQLALDLRLLTGIGLYPRLQVTYTRRGEGSIYLPYEEELGDPNPPFPSGVVEKTFQTVLSLGYQMRGHYHLTAGAGWSGTNNEDHVDGRSADHLSFNAGVWAMY